MKKILILFVLLSNFLNADDSTEPLIEIVSATREKGKLHIVCDLKSKNANPVVIESQKIGVTMRDEENEYIGIAFNLFSKTEAQLYTAYPKFPYRFKITLSDKGKKYKFRDVFFVRVEMNSGKDKLVKYHALVSRGSKPSAVKE